jgi:DNA-binding MarR family transcriptional regulator
MRSASFDYRTLAEFRHQIRRFLHFSEQAARAHGLNSQQHQLLLALKGLPDEARPTVGALAERLQLRHHSTVELLDRLADHGYVTRRSDPEDRRCVLVELTFQGEAILRKLTRIHHEELHSAGPHLLETLRKLIQ